MPNSNHELSASTSSASVQELALGAAEARHKINMLWERTQCVIAVVVVAVTMSTSVFLVVTSSPKEIPTLISMAFGTVVGFYFGRTNHNRPGVTVTTGHGQKIVSQETVGD